MDDHCRTFPWEAARPQMPPYLFDEQGLSYKLQTTIIEYDFEEGEYRSVGTYAHDGVRIEWDGEPQPDTPYQMKSPPWVEGLRMIKEGEKKWREELENRKGTSGNRR